MIKVFWITIWHLFRINEFARNVHINVGIYFVKILQLLFFFFEETIVNNWNYNFMLIFLRFSLF